MASIFILIVEDSILVAEDLASTLQENGYQTEIVDRGDEAISLVAEKAPDLILMDINIKGPLDGIDTAARIREQTPTPIIYLTAFSDRNTVDRAIETAPEAYITKPFEEKDLFIAIDLAFQNFVLKKKALEQVSQETTPDNQYFVNDSIFVKNNGRHKKLNLADILYIEASGSYINIYVKDQKHTLALNLLAFMNQVKQEYFFRVHRSYIVNLYKVESYDANNLYIGEAKIPVSSPYKKPVLEKFHQL